VDQHESEKFYIFEGSQLNEKFYTSWGSSWSETVKGLIIWGSSFREKYFKPVKILFILFIVWMLQKRICGNIWA